MEMAEEIISQNICRIHQQAACSLLRVGNPFKADRMVSLAKTKIFNHIKRR